MKQNPVVTSETLPEVKGDKETEEKVPADYEEDIEGGEENNIRRLEDLTGVGPALAAKLRQAGYTVMSLATSRPDMVAADVKESYSTMRVICNEAKEAALAKMSIQTADQYDIEMKIKQFHIVTGAKGLDDILGGGVPTMSITGTSGRFSSGKSQIGNALLLEVLAHVFVCNICHRKLEKEGELCKFVYHPREGITDVCKGKGVHAKACMVETEPDTFHLDRLKEMARLSGFNNVIWSNLYIFPAKQIPTIKAQYIQMMVIHKLLAGYDDRKLEPNPIDSTKMIWVVKEHHLPQPIILVVIDSMNAKIRAGWGESQNLPLRTRELAEHFQLIEHLASTYNVAWYLTHQVIAPIRAEQGLQMQVKFKGEYYPVGGDYLLHSVNNWIALEQFSKDIAAAYLYDSSYLPKGEAFFRLTAKGIEDAGKDFEKKQEAKEAKKERDKASTCGDGTVHVSV